MKKNTDFAMTRVPEERHHADSTELDAEQQTDLPAENNCDGNLNIKIPRSLHSQLSGEAQQEGVSLEQYIIYKLTR